MKYQFAAIGAAAFVVAGATATPAMDLTFGTYVSPTSTTFASGSKLLLERLEEQTNGEMTWEAFTGGAMGGPKELLGNAGSGVLDASGVVDIYVKSSLPHSSLMSSMLIVGEDPLAMAAAMTEFQLLNCPECLEDHENNNVFAMGFSATGTYHLICKDEVHTAEQLAGKKVRAVGGMGRAIQEMGGTAVSITTAEMYEAMQRGQMDCATGSAAWLDTYNLKDFSKSIVSDSLGSYFGIIGMAINLDVWNEFSDEHKQIMKANMAQLTADIGYAYEPEGEVAIENLKAAGGSVYEFDQTLKDKVAELRAGEYDIAIQQAKEMGWEEGEERVMKFRELVEKWHGLMEEIGDDKDAYVAALNREVYDKIDL